MLQRLRRPHGLDQRAFLLPERKPDLIAHVRQIPDEVRRIADAHRRYRRDDRGPQGKDIRIALDEWNYWYGPHVFGELGTRYFLKDALGIAAGLHEYCPQQRHVLHGQLRPDGQRHRLHQDHQDRRRVRDHGPGSEAYRRHFGELPVATAIEKPYDAGVGPDGRQKNPDHGRGQSDPQRRRTAA